MLAIVRAIAEFTEEEIAWATELILGTVDAPPGFEPLFQVAVIPDGIVGYVCYGRSGGLERAFDLYWLVVDPRYHRRGHGRELLEFVEGEARRAGAGTLLIETAGTNRAARTFYERTGYAEVSQLKDFNRRRADRLVFARDLG